MPTEDSTPIKKLILQLEQLQVQQRSTLAALEAEINKESKESFEVGDRVQVTYPRNPNPLAIKEDSIGLVTKITEKRVKVKSEQSNQIWYRAPQNVKKIPNSKPNVD